mmetsp:Transcript_88169/g.169775  ORF Transcript_88169/g.169775 Transcript_88169/m.169775 type:complete len:384 (-) Transcript_88169:192-1343(-)
MSNGTTQLQPLPVKKELPVDDWMSWFLEASEEDVIRAKQQFIDESLNFKHPDGQLWPAGGFECRCVVKLQEAVAGLPALPRDTDGSCPLNVVDGIDIGNYQASFRTDDRVMVQIASNFHCLENGSPFLSADCGHLVSNYAMDCTQGPAAAFGVPAASLLRAHYAFKADGVNPSLWGQSHERQVNLIADICGAEPYNFCGDCVNGKARLKGNERPVTCELIDVVTGRVKVGLHSDAQVVFRRGSSRSTIGVVSEPQFVDQVCSATLCYGFADSIYKPPPEQLSNLTRALLRAAYEGAYLAAIVRGRRRLLLTLIGGASFRNPHEMILEELNRAHQRFSLHPASQLEEVQLVLYEPGSARRYQQALNSDSCQSMSQRMQQVCHVM